MSHNISSWTRKQRELLELESEEERLHLTSKLQSLTAKDCEKAGISILSLVIEEITTSLYGRTSLLLMRKDKRILPNHSLKVGDEAGKTVSYLTPSRIIISFVFGNIQLSKEKGKEKHQLSLALLQK